LPLVGSIGSRGVWILGRTDGQGLFPSRDRDTRGLGWAQAFTSGSGFTAPHEGVLEPYSRARITPWFHVSPHVQYIVNPGSNDISDATSLGLRGQITFWSRPRRFATIP
jgi:carbohydrate-selective porin OprB